MRSFALILTKSFAVFVTVTFFVAVAVAGIAPPLDTGGDVQSVLVDKPVPVVSDSLVVSESLVNPGDAAPRCAKAGTEPRLWPVGSVAYGRSYDEWSQDWWRWALAIPTAINPILDPNGDSCSYGQHGPVWFLAGAFGGTLTRNCSIGCNKAIFLPILNCEWENAWVDQPILSIADLRALCAGAGTATGLTLEVDGRPMDIQRNRVMSSLFDYSFGPDNIGGQPEGVYFPTISDGVWAMLDPLPPGRHIVHFTAPGYLDITYDLDVVGLELPCSSPPCR